MTRWDPLAFDDARRAVSRALAHAPSDARTAELVDVTRHFLSFQRGHETLSRACAELAALDPAWRAPLVTALALELVDASKQPVVSAVRVVGGRLAALGVDDVGAVARAASELLQRPALVILVALRGARAELLAAARAGISGGLGACSTSTQRLVDALRRTLAFHGPWALAIHLLRCIDPGVSRDEIVGRVRVMVDDLLQQRAVVDDHSAALLSAAAEGLLSSDGAVADLVQALWTLPAGPVRRAALVTLLAAFFPGAKSLGALLVCGDGQQLHALRLGEDDEPMVMSGDVAALRRALPPSAWPLLEWSTPPEGAPSTSVRREGSSTTWTRRHGAVEVSVEVARCMGDSTFVVDVVRIDTGARVHFLDEAPASVAVDHAGTWVWQQAGQGPDRRCTVIATQATSLPPPPIRPRRDEVVLVSELIGPGCPEMFAAQVPFLFAEDE